MNASERLSIAATFVAFAAVVSILAAPELPDPMVTHWNAAGDPDGTLPKALGLWLFPVVVSVLLLLFALLPRVDPLGENVAAFRSSYDWFVVVLTAYLFVLHAGVVAFNLGYRFDFTALVLAGAAALLYYVGVLLSRARRNWFVGVRTPWTLSSDDVWDRTNALAGRLFKLTALVALVGLLAGEYAVYFLLVPALLSAAVAVLYSYYLYAKLEGEGGAPDAG